MAYCVWPIGLWHIDPGVVKFGMLNYPVAANSATALVRKIGDQRGGVAGRECSAESHAIDR